MTLLNPNVVVHNQETLNSNTTRLIPVPQWNSYHPWPSTSGLRHLIFNARHNGFNQCVRRVGRKVLIDEQAFFAWVAETNQTKGEG